MTINTPSLHSLRTELAQHGIQLTLVRKSVKNINFRVYSGELRVSSPYHLHEGALVGALALRMDWAIACHQALQAKQDKNKPAQDRTFTLWGETLNPTSLRDMDRRFGAWHTLGTHTQDELILALYREELSARLGTLAQKWQPIVGKSADQIRLKKMTTRWGSCNTKAARVWLSIYLPAYPYECTEYVFVHELCHLHHADHSPAFWQAVKKAMPDYRTWHDRLANVR